MKNKIIKFLLKPSASNLLLVFLLLFSSVKSQVKKTIYTPYSKPAWAKMIDDPKTNYFVAVDSFNAYWKGKQKPMSEHELFSHVNDDVKRTVFKSPHNPEIENFFEYKRFTNWQKKVLPYVQDDGSILPVEERLNIWKQQQAEIAAQAAKLKAKQKK